jgi:hypothetical protein
VRRVPTPTLSVLPPKERIADAFTLSLRLLIAMPGREGTNLVCDIPTGSWTTPYASYVKPRRASRLQETRDWRCAIP